MDRFDWDSTSGLKNSLKLVFGLIFADSKDVIFISEGTEFKKNSIEMIVIYFENDEKRIINEVKQIKIIISKNLFFSKDK